MSNAETILSLYKEDEREAFRLLFEYYYQDLLLYSHRIIHDVELAEDVVQDCLVSLWYSRRLAHFSGDLDKYLFRTVKFRTLNYIRTRERRVNLHESVGQEEVTLPVNVEEGFTEETEALYLSINQLPDQCKRVFLMAAMDDMKYQEIADTLQVSVNTVKTQMKHALRFLRENLKGQSFTSILFFLSKKILRQSP